MHTLKFVTYTTPIANIRIGYRDECLSSLEFVTEEPSIRDIPSPFSDSVYNQVLEYIRCERVAFDIKLDLSGCTAFQLKVYEELLKIPYGEKRSYKEIAIAIGNPNAARAVGMANNRNPIQMVIPCHRVVSSSGATIGYKAGEEMQDFLLELERLTKKEGPLYDYTKN